MADLSLEEWLAQRQLVIKSLIEALFVYLKQNESQITKSGKIREAFTYAFNQERI
ncbi:MAG: hypothetical protein J6A03_11095 [Lachnospiraceae bacterium]|nr:hypothetical protein [Lachnospiraceae bacterium]